MEKNAFFGSEKLKKKLISSLASKRLVKSIESEANFLFFEKDFLKGLSLSYDNLEQSFEDNVSIYKNEFNIPSSFSILIESIYQGLETKNKESFIFPEKAYLSIKPNQNLNNIWCDFGIWLLTNKKFGLRRMSESIELLEIVEETCTLYEKYKKLPQKKPNLNKTDINILSNDFITILKKIEEGQMTETSVMLYALIQSLVDDSYIYNALYGIYKPTQIKPEHYVLYSNKILELIGQEKIA